MSRPQTAPEKPPARPFLVASAARREEPAGLHIPGQTLHAKDLELIRHVAASMGMSTVEFCWLAPYLYARDFVAQRS